MVINPFIMTVNPFIYFALIIPFLGMWTFAKWNKSEKNTTKWYIEKLFMSILDTLAVFIPLFFRFSSWQFELFIVSVTLANLAIYRVNTVVGAILYLIGYLIIGIATMIWCWHPIIFCISLGIILVIAIWVLTIKNLSKLVKLGGILYGLFALVPLLYCFGVYLNFGFLSLVIGDILLGVQYLQELNGKDNKKTNYLSNCFFYIGVWLSAISLV